MLGFLDHPLDSERVRIVAVEFGTCTQRSGSIRNVHGAQRLDSGRARSVAGRFGTCTQRSGSIQDMHAA